MREEKRRGGSGDAPERSALADLLEAVAFFILRVFYRLRIEGSRRLPRHGGVLLIPNHLSWMDVPLLVMGIPRPIRFIAAERFFGVPVLGAFFRLFAAVPIAPQRAKDAIKSTTAAVRQGAVVCLFPEGELSRTGLLGPFQAGVAVMARRLGGAPVLPVHIDGLWGSVFSFSDGRFFRKRPERLRRRVVIRIGPPQDPETCTPQTLRRAVAAEAWAAYRERESPSGGWETHLRALWNRREAWCGGAGPSGEFFRWDGQEMVSMVAAARRALLRWPAGEAVAIDLPPGPAAVSAHLGALARGLIPVAMPAIEAAERASLDAFLCSQGIRLRVGPATGSLGWSAREDLGRTPDSTGRRNREAEPCVGLVTRGPDGWNWRRTGWRSLIAGTDQLADVLLFQRREVILAPRSFNGPGAWWAGWWLPLLRGWPLVFGSVPGRGAGSPWREATSVILDGAKPEIRPEESGLRPRLVLHFQGLDDAGEGALGELFPGAVVRRGLEDPVSGCVLAVNTLEARETARLGLARGWRAGSCGRELPGTLLSVPDSGEDGWGRLWAATPACDDAPPDRPRPTGVTARIDSEGFVFAKE